jgi:hypothetical protein
MNSTQAISAIALRDYAQAHGWRLVPEAVNDRLFVLNHDRFAPRQLAFPIDESAPDYRESIDNNIQKLALLEQRTIESVRLDLQQTDSDVISYRLFSDLLDQPSIPLAHAKKLLDAAEDMLRVGACTALEPKSSYAKLNRKEATDIASVARFAHTQEGSFIINIACPLRALDPQTQFSVFDEDEPTVRRATRALYGGLTELVNAIESGTTDALVRGPKAGYVSRNLCEALLEFEDADLKNSLDVGFRWATARPIKNGALHSKVSIPRDYFSQINRVRTKLKPSSEPQRMEYMCIVEKLSGKPDEELLRSGEVTLKLFDGDRMVLAKAYLSVDQYAQAMVSHEKSRFIRISGVLTPGSKPQLLDKIERFELQN